MNRLQELRAQIAPLNAERQQLVRSPFSKAELLAQIKSTLGDEKADAREHLRRKLAATANGVNPRLLSLNASGGHRLDDLDGKDVHNSFAALLIAAAGTKALEAMCAEIIGDMPLHPDKETRVRRLTEVRAELDRLERLEERIISDAEIEGTYYARRPDSRPEIILEIVP